MEKIVLHDMDKLLSPVEQAELIGMIKEPEQIQDEQKQNYFLYGMITISALTICFLIIQHIIEKNKRKKIN